MPPRLPRPNLGYILLLAPVLWGATFPAAKEGFQAMGLFPFMAWTRTLGFLTILAAVPFLLRGQVTREALRRVIGPGLLLGSLIFVAYTLQSAGLQRTTSTNAGFITGLYVVFTPILGLLLFRQRAGWAVWAAVVVSVVGLALLSVPALDDLRLRFGDVLVLMGAVVWAGHVVGVGYFASRHPATLLSLAQMGATSALHLLATIPFGLRAGDALDVWWLLLITGVLGSGVAYTLQVIAQTEMSAGRAVVILAGESVAAAAFSRVWLDERLLAHQWVGAALVVAAMAVSELGARRAEIERIDPSTG